MNTPEPGTQDYKDQVQRIITMGRASQIDFKDKQQLSQFTMLFILDMSFHRAAICEALKELERGI